MNPFITGGYHSPAYFCNRNSETSRLLSNIKNNMNITMFSIRKLGKTSLLRHVLEKIKKEKSTSGVFIDLYPTKNLNDLVKEFSNAILLNLYTKPEKIFKQIQKLFKGFTPVIKFDKITGKPQVELDLRSVSETEYTLKGLFSYIRERSMKEKIVIVFDEFQQITNYPEKNIEALLRSEIQHLSNVVFIFSGSNKSLITSMFNISSRPFYMSTDMIELKRIDKEDYKNFISKHFNEKNIKVNKDTIEYIYNWADGITFNIQHICNKLYGSNPGSIDLTLVKKEILNILNENESIYIEYMNLITSHQWKLLHSVAKEGKVNKPMSKEFISKYSLGTPSSVKSGLNALLKKNLLYHEHSNYFVTDIYFSKWLEMQ